MIALRDFPRELLEGFLVALRDARMAAPPAAGQRLAPVWVSPMLSHPPEAE